MTLDDEIENLRRIPLLAFFEVEALQMLAFASETRLLRSGDLLFQRGEESDGGFILILGAVALSRDETRPVHILRPWALIGEMALVAPSLRPVTARAQEPSTVLKVRRALFHQILEQYPITAARARDFLRERLVDFTRRAASDFDSV